MSATPMGCPGSSVTIKCSWSTEVCEEMCNTMCSSTHPSRNIRRKKTDLGSKTFSPCRSMVTKPGAYEIAHCRSGASCLKWQVSADENRLTAPREPAKVTRSHQSSPDTIERRARPRTLPQE
uniref:Uncharacterized protein n=1 Tax=Anopheles coluzzii TaxID=1518534 RepID=A0A8W7PMK8_ANOCL